MNQVLSTLVRVRSFVVHVPNKYVNVPKHVHVPGKYVHVHVDENVVHTRFTMPVVNMFMLFEQQR